ncbi:MAG TPA: ABC transporter permease [Puia sp.]|nr:ABC transporter permease [Puia sp.]
MLKNYFVIAFRNLRKHALFSIVNLSGLAVGLAVFWLIGLYVADELSYDRSYANADRLYRVVQYGSWAEGSFKSAPTSAPFAPTLLHDYSEIEATARIDQEGGGILQYGDKRLKTEDIYFTDASIFTLFGYPFLYGNPKDALAKPQSIVLTRSLAVRLFGKAEDALNKTVVFDNNYPNTVTGVIEDVPANSHLVFSALRSFPSNYTDDWRSFRLYTYILLHKKADVKKLEAKLPGFFTRYLKPLMGLNLEYRMELQPVTSIHLHSNLEYEISPNGSIRYVYIFSLVGLLVLVIAMINYMNLSTARSSMRVKEIGVRKVIGSGRRQLVVLFLAESLMFTLLAAMAAGVLSGLLLPLFNQLSGKSLSLWQFGVAPTLSILLGFTLFTGLVGGLYPALLLSGFRTIPALKGQMGNLYSTTLFRKSLVTFQFIITIAMIAGSGIIYQQLHYMLTRDLGFNKDQVLTLHISDRMVRKNIPALKAQLLQNPLIEGVSAASNPIGTNSIGSYGFNFEVNGRIDPQARVAQAFMVDADYLPTLQIKLVKGRNFAADRPADKDAAFLVNETLVKELGWTDPIGKRIQFPGDSGQIREVTVIGVVRDFNIYSLQYKIAPLVLQMPPVDNEKDNLYVRVSKVNIPGAVKYIEGVYRKFETSSPFEYHFLDANFSRQYATERQQGSLIITLTVLAILIACLGLFGLVAFSAEQRRKEIGIRKVLGADVPSLVGLLSRDLLKLVVIAMLIASPIAWWVMQRWLNEFAYRIDMSPWLFVAAGLAAAAIALATISVQAVRAATANPVKTLRTE